MPIAHPFGRRDAARIGAAATVLALLLQASPAGAQDIEARTRAELLARIREQKAKTLGPPKPTGVERALLYIEKNRILERFTVGDG